MPCKVLRRCLVPSSLTKLKLHSCYYLQTRPEESQTHGLRTSRMEDLNLGPFGTSKSAPHLDSFCHVPACQCCHSLLDLSQHLGCFVDNQGDCEGKGVMAECPICTADIGHLSSSSQVRYACHLSFQTGNVTARTSFLHFFVLPLIPDHDSHVECCLNTPRTDREPVTAVYFSLVFSFLLA